MNKQEIIIIVLGLTLGLALGTLIELNQFKSKICKPLAYYGASQDIIDPECSNEDSNCTVDPCR